MPKLIEFVVCLEDEDERLDIFLSKKINDTTRSAVQRLIASENVLVNGKSSQNKYKLKLNDKIVVNIPDPVSIEAQAEDIPLDIRYEDDDLLVVNKPKGMVVHPAAGNHNKTLVNALLFHCGDSLSGINGAIRPGIVHRIDKDTSGLLIVAKSDFAHNGLAKQIKEHSFKREYEAIVYGNIKHEYGKIDKPIGRHPIDRKKMCVTDRNSKNALTYYKVINRYNGFTHLVLNLETGRTHQIRVHMSYIGHPVAGDPVYGPKKVITELNGQCLHARMIGFIHPRNGKYIEIDSGLPAYFTNFINKINTN